MPSSHLTETQEAWVSHAVERLLAAPEESSRRFFLQQNPELQLQDMVLYLATQVPKRLWKQKLPGCRLPQP